MISSARPSPHPVSILIVALATVAASLALASPTALAAQDVACPGQSLQAAITAATPGGTITFTGTCTEHLDIDKNLSIAGTGSGSAILNAAGTNLSAIDITNEASVTLSGLTIRGGSTVEVGGGFGGGIDDNGGGGTITIVDSVITDNSASIDGGGIWVSGTLTLTSSAVTNNNAALSGGGIFSSGGNVTVTDSTISGNSSSADGGVSNNEIATLLLTSSTISGNESSLFGGGIGVDEDANVTIVGSTVHGNTSGQDGAGIDNDGTLVVRNSTITDNTGGSVEDDVGGVWTSGSAMFEHVTVAGNTGETGGIFNANANPTSVTVTASILASNSGTVPNCSGKVASGGGNVVGDETGCTFADSTADLVGTSGSPVDPGLGSLTNNGGPTQTMALRAGSPARNRTSPSCVLSTDQRGITRPQGSGCDSGAYEAGSNLAPTVDAGPNTATQRPAPAVLGGSASDDGLPNATLTTTWTKAFGPGTVTFANASSPQTNATFSAAGVYVLQLEADDGDLSSTDTTTVTVSDPPPPPPPPPPLVTPPPIAPTVGLVDPASGMWYLQNSSGVVTSFVYGNPVDLPISGDWNGDGNSTPGLYRQSDGFFYARNSNTGGPADNSCYAGNPADVPISGDWDGDGDDNVGIYRPSEQTFYLFTTTCTGSPMGSAQISFLFGNPGDKPVAGDWDGDGKDEVGLHRESSGFFYWRNTLDFGIADGQIFFGDPNDRFVSGDWGTLDGADTPAIFRPSDLSFYFRHTLTQGNADSQLPRAGAGSGWLPVAGTFGLG